MGAPAAFRRSFSILATALALMLGAFGAARADDGTATVAGTVRTPAGAPVAGARVTLSGPARAETQTDANGAFSVSVPQGLYRVDVGKGGYNPATLSDYTALAGASAPLAISLSPVDLTSLQTIGRVTSVSRGGSTINTGAATTSFVGAQTFANFAAPQINDVLQHVADVNLEHLGSQPDTTIVLNASQPYETQVLIDGHPIALGQYGVWSSQFFPSFLVAGAETQSGPGNTTPFANIAVAGTVNLLTPGYTQKQTAEFVVGTDSYNAQYSHFLTTGSAGRLAYVAGLGYGSLNGPYYQTTHCVVSPDSAANDNTAASNGIIQFCGDASGSLVQKGEILKLKYDLSSATSFELGFVGAQGSYQPQGASYGTYLGTTKVDACLPSFALACTNPQYASLIGTSIPAYAWYPGSNVTDNQPMFSAQLRTSLGNNTLLVRPYAGNISPDVVNGRFEGGYPQFFSPPGTVPSLPPGTPIPAAGLPGGGNAFELACGVGFAPTAFSQVNSPANTLVVKNGQEECFQAPFSEYEIDKLYGGTASFIHPMGESLLQLTYDYHGTDTFAYYNSPANIAVPDSTERYTTFALTGDLRVVRNLGVQLGIYDTTWKLFGQQPQLNAAGVPVVDASGAPVLIGLDRSITRFDPHVALVLRPKNDLSYRFSYGTSETFPYAGQVTGLPFYQPPSATTQNQSFLLQKNPFLNPERSIGFDLGADKRFGNGSVLALDLQSTVIHDVFEPLTFPSTVPNENITEPINVARLRSQLATLKYTYAPPHGLGFNLSATAARSIATGIPPSVYAAGPALPANNVQICGNGQSYPNNPVCIPYLKGYGQLTYVARDATYAALGVEYEGKNNSYFQPPFAQVDFTFRKPVTKTLELQVSAQNLLNTNTFYNLPYPNMGVPLVEGTATGLTSGTSSLVPAAPRTVRIQLRLHSGR